MGVSKSIGQQNQITGLRSDRIDRNTKMRIGRTKDQRRPGSGKGISKLMPSQNQRLVERREITRSKGKRGGEHMKGRGTEIQIKPKGHA